MSEVKKYNHSHITNITLCLDQIFISESHLPLDDHESYSCRITYEQIQKILMYLKDGQMFHCDFVTTALQFNSEELSRQKSIFFKGSYTHIGILKNTNIISVEIAFKDIYYYFKLDSHTDVVIVEVEL